MQVRLPVLRLNRVPAQSPPAVTDVGVVRCVRVTSLSLCERKLVMGGGYGRRQRTPCARSSACHTAT